MKLTPPDLLAAETQVDALSVTMARDLKTLRAAEERYDQCVRALTHAMTKRDEARTLLAESTAALHALTATVAAVLAPAAEPPAVDPQPVPRAITLREEASATEA